MSDIPSGKVRRYKDLRFWAEGGMVAMVDERNGSFEYKSPMVMRQRAKAFFAEAEYMKDKGGHYADERRALVYAARDMIEVIQEAEAQGCPLIPQVADQQRHEKRRIYSPGVGPGRHEQRTPAGLILPGGF
jgi:hypothetical protein